MQNFNFQKWMGWFLSKIRPKKLYDRPHDILTDRYLTQTQKKFILETMLVELKGKPFECETGVMQRQGEGHIIKQRNSILRAKANLQ